MSEIQSSKPLHDEGHRNSNEGETTNPTQEGLGEGLPGLEEVWGWQVFMNDLGPRYTGNKAHQAYVDFLDIQLKAFWA